MKPASSLIAAALALMTLPTFAGDDCQVPTERWQSREAVQQMAASKGWTLQRLKIDDGCYELRATDAQGQRLKAKVDPETLQVLKIKRKERRRDHRRDREGPDGATAPAQAAPGSPSPFTPGATPRARID